MATFILSNKKRIKLYCRIVIFLVIINTFFSFFLFFSDNQFSKSTLLKAISIVLFLILIVVYYRLRYFEYDFSGEVISLKSYHPLCLWPEKRIEFPKDMLENYKIIATTSVTELNLYFRPFKEKLVRIHFDIHGLGKAEINGLKNSLENIDKERNILNHFHH